MKNKRPVKAHSLSPRENNQERRYSSTSALSHRGYSPRKPLVQKNNQSQQSDIHLKGLHSKKNTKVSKWESVPNVAHRTKLSPRDQNNSKTKTSLKKTQAFSCSNLNKNIDTSNTMGRYRSDRHSRESVAQLRHSSPALGSKKPPMRFGLK